MVRYSFTFLIELKHRSVNVRENQTYFLKRSGSYIAKFMRVIVLMPTSSVITINLKNAKLFLKPMMMLF